MISTIGRFAAAAPILAGALCLIATSARAEVPAGVEAWSRGDYAAAVQEWQSLAAQGDATALFQLAQAYKFGKGVPQDLTKAEELFGEAAAKGQTQAADNLGLLLYQRGDRAGALPFIQAASERGDARAQYLLGISSFNGDVVPKDWVRAYALMTQAQRSGLPQAASAITQMDKHIPLELRQQGVAFTQQIAGRSEAKPAEQQVALIDAGAMPPALSLDVGVSTPATNVTKATDQTGSPSGRWRVQLGAFSVKANADALWNRVKNRPELSGHERIDAGSGKVTRLLAGGFISEADAARACSRISASGITCLVTRN